MSVKTSENNSHRHLFFFFLFPISDILVAEDFFNPKNGGAFPSDGSKEMGHQMWLYSCQQYPASTVAESEPPPSVHLDPSQCPAVISLFH